MGAVLLVASLLALAVPANAERDPPSNALGTIEMPAHPSAGPDPVPLRVLVTFEDRELLERSHQVLLSFNVHDTDAVSVDFGGIETANGTPVPIVKDERDKPGQPRVFVNATDLANATAIDVNATVETHANGRFHLGFMVIPFNDNWAKLPLGSNGTAELYGFSVLASSGHATEGLDPPLRGSGNLVPGPGAGLAVAAVILAAAWTHRRRDGDRRP